MIAWPVRLKKIGWQKGQLATDVDCDGGVETWLDTYIADLNTTTRTILALHGHVGLESKIQQLARTPAERLHIKLFAKRPDSKEPGTS